MLSKSSAVIMDLKDLTRAIAPEKKTLAAIRKSSRKNGINKLSMREINREIRAYRRERS